MWGKTERDDGHALVGWLPLHQHLADAAGVAGLLVDEWVSPQVVDRIGAETSRGRDDVRALSAWLAAVHDVGKASPAFVVQVESLASRAHRHGLPVDQRLGSDPERAAIGHALVGNVAVREWLRERVGDADVAQQLGAIVGSHHGVPPERGQLVHVGDRPDLAGVDAWLRARHEVLDWAAGRVGDGFVEALGELRLTLPTQVLLTAIVIVADWIASDTDHFDLLPLSSAEDDDLAGPDAGTTASRLRHGWTSVALPPRWRPRDDGDTPDGLLRDRFGREAVRPVQEAAVASARSSTRPGLTIIEAPMGEGKTEAALLAVEILAARTGADGCFVALPTRATSDAMFSRVLGWLERLPGREGDVGVQLAHGTASLNDAFAGLPFAGRFSSIGDDVRDGRRDRAIAHGWFRGRKRATLAQFVVGTIDQVLFMALKSKHVMLRHLGLAGKVVIIDEVHAYDTYMAQFLHRALHWLGAYRVPVVLLSATLPSARRAELVAAYDSGAGTSSADATGAGYPSVTTSGGELPLTVPASGRSTTVRLTRASDELDDLVALLVDRLADGGCAVVVRNTVARVQETADRLAQVFGDDVIVNHSRFLACDRARIDTTLLRLFGPPGGTTRRPARHVVVASQVVEQSLDVDFDVMVSDLAPIDLLLQRMGRLHRHARERPPRLREAECVVVGVDDWDAEPVRAIAGSRQVYVEDTLLRSAALVLDRREICLPADIPALVESGYGDGVLGSPSWQSAMASARKEATAKARQRQRNADVFRLGTADGASNLLGWIKAGVGEADDDPRQGGAAQVRDGVETVEVVVLVRDGAGGHVVPEWIASPHAGEPVPPDFPVSRGQARALAACVLRLPLALSHPGVIETLITELEKTYVASFEVTALLRGSLVLALDPDRTRRLTVGGTTYLLAYSEARGLVHGNA